MTKKEFEKAMDNDLNISEALAHLFEFIREVNAILNENKLSKPEATEILDFLKKLDDILAVMNFEENALEEDIRKLMDERENARKEKDFLRADEIRNLLKDKGIILEDTTSGTRWKKA